MAALVEQEQARRLGRPSVIAPRANRALIAPALPVLPVLIGVGLGFFALGWACYRSDSKPHELARDDRVREAAASDSVPGWIGTWRSSDGSAVALRLTRLHALEHLQAFEARSLRERLALPDGEPFRLELAFVAASPESAGREGRGATSTALAMGGVWIEDERGRALEPIASPPAGAASIDPLRVLVAPASGPLMPGHSASLVLWGREPAAGARVLGLVDAALPLERAEISLGDVDTALARIERATTEESPKR